jgi:hypothetical protein
MCASERSQSQFQVRVARELISNGKGPARSGPVSEWAAGDLVDSFVYE